MKKCKKIDFFYSLKYKSPPLKTNIRCVHIPDVSFNIISPFLCYFFCLPLLSEMNSIINYNGLLCAHTSIEMMHQEQAYRAINQKKRSGKKGLLIYSAFTINNVLVKVSYSHEGACRAARCVIAAWLRRVLHIQWYQ